MKFVSIQQDLAEGCIPKRKSAALFNPAGGGFRCGNIDFVFPGSGDDRGQTAHDIFFRQGIDQTTIILFRHQIPAIRIHAFLQDIGHTFEIGAERIQHGFAVFIRSTSSLRFLTPATARFVRQGLVHRAVQFRFQRPLPLQTGNLLAKIIDLLLHLCIGGIVFRRQCPFLGTAGFQKSFCSLPRLITLLTQF